MRYLKRVIYYYFKLLDDIINQSKYEIETLKDIENKIIDINQEKRIITIKIRNQFLSILDNVNKENYKNLQNDMINIYNSLTSLTDDDLSTVTTKLNQSNKVDMNKSRDLVCSLLL